jgi:LuxR family maltose regulon positive regulatory protein
MLGLLDRLHAAATAAGRDGSVLELRVLQALAHHAHGDLPAALAAMGRALGGAPEPDSYVRLYLDEGAPMMALLNETASANDPLTGSRGGEKVRGRACLLLQREPTVRDLEPTHSLGDPLSQRELEVLRLLDSELTGPEIARKLHVTLNTLRTHTKRIFIKLDANTRAAAVHRAREQRLL